MSKKVMLVLLTVALSSIFSQSLAAFSPEQTNIGENKILYQPKYADGRDLYVLLRSYLKGVDNTDVEYVEGINTLVITAPKETHQLLLKILQQADIEPDRLEIEFYLLEESSAAKGKSEKSVSESVATDSNDMATWAAKNYSILGSGKLLISTDKKKTYRNEINLFSDSSTSENYIVTTGSIEVVGDIVRFSDLSLLIIYYEQLKSDLIKDNKQIKTLMKQNFSMKIGEKVLLGSVTSRTSKQKGIVLAIVVKKV